MTFGLLKSSFDRHGKLGRLPEERYFACEVRIETIENMGQERGIVKEREREREREREIEELSDLKVQPQVQLIALAIRGLSAMHVGV